MQEIPIKKTDKELFSLIKECIDDEEYVFVTHAKQRLRERFINDLDVLALLEGKRGRQRARNHRKDSYDRGRDDWKYCIEGCTRDDEKIRTIITFDEYLMLIITVMRIP